MTFTVGRVDDEGRLLELRWEFNVPFEHPSLRWLAWNGKAFNVYRPPRLGETAPSR